MASAQVRELPIVGGHLALDFANTIDDPANLPRHDHIGTYEELLRWAVRVGIRSPRAARRLAVPPPDGGVAAVDRAAGLRDALVDIFTAVATGEPVPAERWETLRAATVEAMAHAELLPAADGHELGWPGADLPDVVLWPVARAAVDLLTSPELALVKRCAGCTWLFVDRSRNHSRRWCAMEDCGSHDKIRRYVARRAAAREAERRR